LALLPVVAVPGAARYFMAAGTRSVPDNRPWTKWYCGIPLSCPAHPGAAAIVAHGN